MNPSAVAQGVGLLKGYRLEFPYRGKRWKGFVANVFPNQNSHVYGVLWDLKHNDLNSLDDQEGVSEGIYERFEVDVEVSGKPVKCFSYRITDSTRKQSILEHGENQKPSRIYKEVILCGAKENNLPSEYINFLENVADNGYDGAVDVNIPLHLLRKKPS